MAALFSLVRDNGGTAWLVAIGIGLSSYLCLSWGLRWLSARLGSAATGWRPTGAAVLAATHPLARAYLSAYLMACNLNMPQSLMALLARGLMVVVVLQFGLWGNCLIQAWTTARSAAGDGTALASLNVFKVIAQIVLWLSMSLLLLENLGFNVGTLVTSLGIGGVAVALALQNILGDLFASLSIAMDKPFVVGDYIEVGDDQGTVKRIGLKTTRVASLSGEELIFSNGDLLRSRVRNFRRMGQRRIVFSFGVDYGTPPKQIAQINTIVREAIQGQAAAKFDRVHFKSLGDSALEFEAVYFMLDQNYLAYMDAQEAINLAMLTRFSEAGIGFAFPTQTINIASMPPAGQRGS